MIVSFFARLRDGTLSDLAFRPRWTHSTGQRHFPSAL